MCRFSLTNDLFVICAFDETHGIGATPTGNHSTRDESSRSATISGHDATHADIVREGGTARIWELTATSGVVGGGHHNANLTGRARAGMRASGLEHALGDHSQLPEVETEE